MSHAAAMETIEAARLNPATTDKEIRRLAALVHRLTVKAASQEEVAATRTGG